MSKPIIVAHRVNTFRRAEKFYKKGIKFIEIDVQRRDTQIIVEHGISVYSLRRSRIAKAFIVAMYKIATPGNPMTKPATLDQYLSLFGQKFSFWFDIKSRGIESKVLELIDKYHVRSPIIFSSGYYDVLENIKKMRRDVATMLGNVSFYLPKSNLIDLIDSVEADGISIEAGYLDKKIIDMVKNAGKLIAVWTINDCETAIRYSRHGVDIIITDYPDYINKCIQKL